MAQRIAAERPTSNGPRVSQVRIGPSWDRWYRTNPTVQVAGMVTTQAIAISPTHRQLVPLRPAVPAPTTDEAAAWVVEMGTPRAVAPKIAVVAPMLAATPVRAFRLVSRSPMVRMMRHPPQTVPRAMAA